MNNKPFRVVVSIILGGAAGRALQLMASGMQCAAETRDGAVKLYDDYIDAASAVLSNRSIKKGTVFGIISIVNVDTAELSTSALLIGG